MKKILPILILIVVAFTPQIEAQQGARTKLQVHKLLTEFFMAAEAGDADKMLEHLPPLDWGTRDTLVWLKDPEMLQPLITAFQACSADDLIIRTSLMDEVPMWLRDNLFVVAFPISKNVLKQAHLKAGTSLFLGPLIGTIIPETPIPRGVVFEVETTYVFRGQNGKMNIHRAFYETYMQMAEKAAERNMQLVIIPIIRTKEGYLAAPHTSVGFR